ncbi:hypothetical protein OEZ85_013071 [Tetradesmus obliquus]|uniref:ABC transporter domain-containing protein n=1 Tax=Tetradesmus obliquus TaxID=3088 RepID=A0ABY8U4U0_TETOB|nr:hypothetical protein OEZ85_013071 [Tetradesmus obliquus]
MSGRGGGRGWYYKQKYGGGASRNRQQQEQQGGQYGNQADEGYRGGSGNRQPEAAAPAGWDGDDDDVPSQAGYQAGSRLLGDAQQLFATLNRLDGKGYKAYRDIQGAWQFSGFQLIVDHCQGDPYAAPSRLRVQMPATVAALPPELWSSKLRRIALGDWLARKLAAEANRASAAAAGQAQGWHGAKGGDVTVDLPGQHVLERTAVLVSTAGDVEARFTVGLPAQGRSIMGPWAGQILTQHLARAVQAALMYPALDGASIWRHITTVEDTEVLRAALPGLGLVGFVGDGAILPRKSGASDLPMPPSAGLVPFSSPASLAVEVALPHRGRVRGMGIKQGITLIAGGGFHGKSTLLQALEAGVYNKVPDDGRELVVMLPDAVKVSAEDGRRVEAVDISNFINNLPGGSSTVAFRSDDASGSTSQAANIQEALELGASVLLMDEDTCATNFMMRDARMAALVAPAKEPITPFSSRIALLRAAGISTVLVMGGSGDYFEHADTVIVMDNYLPSDQTQAAHAIAAQHAATMAAVTEAAPAAAAAAAVGQPVRGGVKVTPRVPQCVYAGGQNDYRGVKTHVRGLHHIQYGDQDIQLSAAEQLVDKSQTRAVADALKWLQAQLQRQQQQQQQQGGKTLLQWLNELDAAIEQQGLDVLAPQLLGNLARPRRFEVAAAINRIRTLQMTQQQQQQQQ